MAQPSLDDTISAPATPLPQADIYQPGGPVGQMQADLARRLAQGGTIVRDPANARGGERMVRFVSVAAGCAALLAACFGAVFLILR